MLIACGNNPSSDVSYDVDSSFVDEHNAANSLDIVGQYSGLFPCVDCKGVEVKINLNEDSSFLYISQYIESETITFQYKGHWHIDKSIITLEDTNHKMIEKYFVGENFIQQVDAQGNRMTGEKEDDYILKKQLSNDSIM